MASATDNKRRALGKGLESLLPSRPASQPAAAKPAAPAAATESVDLTAAAATPAPAPAGKPLEIPVEQIERNPWQTRSHFDEAALNELAASIRASGWCSRSWCVRCRPAFMRSPG